MADLSLVAYWGLYCGLCAEHTKISRYIMVQKDGLFGVLNVQPKVRLRTIRKPGSWES